MEVKVCRNCKKLFQYIAGPVLCPKCKQIEEEYFQTVKDYLRENPGDTLYEVSQKTGVSVKLIEKFLREGRLEVPANSPVELTCERCGKKIPTGRFCAECMRNLADELHEVKRTLVKEETPDTGAKMRYLSSKKIH